MDIKLINIGFGNIVSANRVVAIVSPESAPIKRVISDARERGTVDRCHLWSPHSGRFNYGFRTHHPFRHSTGNGGPSVCHP